MWTLSQPFETELKTNRPLDKVVTSLKERAIFTDYSFTIPAKTISVYRGTEVHGRVSDDNSKTTVFIKISPSADFKAGVFLLTMTILLASIIVLVLTIKENNLNIRLLAVSTVGLFGLTVIILLIMKLFLKFSVWLQRESIEGLINRDQQNGPQQKVYAIAGCSVKL